MVEKRSADNEFVHRLLHGTLKQVEAGFLGSDHCFALIEQVADLVIDDELPESTLRELIQNSQELINVGYHGCSDVKASRYFDHLEDLLIRSHGFSLEETVFFKKLVNEMRRRMLK